jgi:hypothetical protein
MKAIYSAAIFGVKLRKAKQDYAYLQRIMGYYRAFDVTAKYRASHLKSVTVFPIASLMERTTTLTSRRGDNSITKFIFFSVLW